MKKKEMLAKVFVYQELSTQREWEIFLAGYEAAKREAIELTKAPAWIVVRDMPSLGDEEGYEYSDETDTWGKVE